MLLKPSEPPSIRPLGKNTCCYSSTQRCLLCNKATNLLYTLYTWVKSPIYFQNKHSFQSNLACKVTDMGPCSDCMLCLSVCVCSTVRYLKNKTQQRTHSVRHISFHRHYHNVSIKILQTPKSHTCITAQSLTISNFAKWKVKWIRTPQKLLNVILSSPQKLK